MSPYPKLAERPVSLSIRVFLLAGTLTSTLLLAAVLALRTFASSSLSGLLCAGLLAAALAAISTGVAVRWLTSPLERLSRRMAEMAVSEPPDRDFPSSGYRETQEIEATFRVLLSSLDESRRAREKSYAEAMRAVVTAADARDHETSGHSFRVALYALALARRLGLPGEKLKDLEWGSLLHDVGKMVVPDEILRKRSDLTREEWQIMRCHPDWGHDMLAGVGFLSADALEIVHSHHERWDGNGYPRRLAGESISLGARIFAVVDAYDAITSDRPYRRARSHQTAVAELDQAAGAQLDPRIVEVFHQIPEAELRRLREFCHDVHPGIVLPEEADPATAPWQSETGRGQVSAAF
jgi:putative nucleotidyltransferase with HDIG domain